ncbi:MAG TPA: guanine deaminase [Nannocystis exedens]|nr:guanine deaminase [Nannocystis exedens]
MRQIRAPEQSARERRAKSEEQSCGGKSLPSAGLRGSLSAVIATVNTPRTTQLRGPLLAPARDSPTLRWIDDGVITIDSDGTIRSVEAATADLDLPETHPGTVLLPGLVDTHVHYPQTRVRGSASGPLLTWLRATVFPEEAKFADPLYAATVAEEFCSAMIRQGTPTASIFGSPHPKATDLLFATLARRGLRAHLGLTLMDRGAPPQNLLDAAAAIGACEALIERWHLHDRGRLRFCVTPRFALSCTPTLLRDAALLAERHNLQLQTHLAENDEELRATAACFPDQTDYLDVYRAHGLLGERSLFAHCIHLNDNAWDRLAASRAAVAHCPDSNFFLGSGIMSLQAATSRDLRVGLGTDIGAGRTFSLRRVAARAYDAALLDGSPTDAQALLWYATRGGALALGQGEQLGLLEAGYEADLIALELPPKSDSRDRLDALLFDLDAAPVRATYVRGRRLSPL